MILKKNVFSEELKQNVTPYSLKLKKEDKYMIHAEVVEIRTVIDKYKKAQFLLL